MAVGLGSFSTSIPFSAFNSSATFNLRRFRGGTHTHTFQLGTSNENMHYIYIYIYICTLDKKKIVEVVRNRDWVMCGGKNSSNTVFLCA